MFEELLERAKEKEEKEAKKRRHLADDFTELLYTLKVSVSYHGYDYFRSFSNLLEK